jgi:hypothetical protein
VVAEQAFTRPYWSRAQRRRPASFRVLQLKLDVAHGVAKVHGGDVVGAVFTPEEIELLKHIAAGERIVGLDLPQHIAAYQMKWIGDGGYRHDDEEGV